MTTSSYKDPAMVTQSWRSYRGRIYIYLCTSESITSNVYEFDSRRGGFVLATTLCDNFIKYLHIPVFHTNKTERLDTNEKLLKMAVNAQNY